MTPFNIGSPSRSSSRQMSTAYCTRNPAFSYICPHPDPFVLFCLHCHLIAVHETLQHCSKRFGTGGWGGNLHARGSGMRKGDKSHCGIPLHHFPPPLNSLALTNESLLCSMLLYMFCQLATSALSISLAGFQECAVSNFPTVGSEAPVAKLSTSTGNTFGGFTNRHAVMTCTCGFVFGECHAKKRHRLSGSPIDVMTKFFSPPSCELVLR